jgi:hypothetical protein
MMSPLFKKLNFKNHSEILVLNSFSDFEKELKFLENKVVIRRNVKEINAIEFSLAFVTKQKELDVLAKVIIKKSKGDALLWFAYPKGSSKKLKCEFNRDIGWDMLEKNGFEKVRQVAIDEDWSALRFRRREFIKAILTHID